MKTTEQELRDRLRASVEDVRVERELLGRAHVRAGRLGSVRRTLAVAGMVVVLVAVGGGVQVLSNRGLGLRPGAGSPAEARDDQRMVEFSGARMLVPGTWAVDDGGTATPDREPEVCTVPESRPVVLLGLPAERCPLSYEDRLQAPGVALARASSDPGWDASLLREGTPQEVGAMTGFRSTADGNELVLVPDVDLVVQILPGTARQDVEALLSSVSAHGSETPPFLAWDEQGVLTVRDGRVVTLVEPEAGDRLLDVSDAPQGTREEFRLAVATNGVTPGGRRVSVLGVVGGETQEVWSGTATPAYGPGSVAGLQEGGVSGDLIWSSDGGHLAFVDVVDGRGVVRIVSLVGEPAGDVTEVRSPGLEVPDLEGVELYLDRWTDDDRLVFLSGDGADGTLTLPVARAEDGAVRLPDGRLQPESLDP